MFLFSFWIYSGRSTSILSVRILYIKANFAVNVKIKIKHMSRPRKNTVDYFPHFCQHNKTMYILEQRFGNNGYTFWFKLLEELGNHEGHFIDLREENEQEYLAAKTRLSVPEILEILNLLAKLESIDQELWKDRVIWCAKFVDNVADAYKKRSSPVPSKPFFPDENPQATGLPTPETQ